MGMPVSTSDGSLRLFTHKFSAYALRAEIAMVEKGIPFDAIKVDLKNKPKELLEVNPLYSKVPSLVHNGNIVLESLIILQYLDEAFPDTVPLLPKAPLARSKCRFWADYIYKTELALLPGVWAAPGSPERETGLVTYAKFMRTLDSAMSEFSKDGPFFCGERFGFLDVIMAPSLPYFSVFAGMGFKIPEDLPRLKKCMKAILEHKSVRETVPTMEAVQKHVSSHTAAPKH